MKLSQMIRNLWIYRRLIALAVVLGIALGFVFFNQQEVDVKFPLLGKFTSSTGIVMLLSAALGAAGTWLVMTFRITLRQAREKRTDADSPAQAKAANEDDRGKVSSGAVEQTGAAERASQALRSVAGGKEAEG